MLVFLHFLPSLSVLHNCFKQMCRPERPMMRRVTDEWVFFPPILEEEVAASSGTIKSNVSPRYRTVVSATSAVSHSWWLIIDSQTRQSGWGWGAGGGVGDNYHCTCLWWGAEFFSWVKVWITYTYTYIYIKKKNQATFMKLHSSSRRVLCKSVFTTSVPLYSMLVNSKSCYTRADCP